MSRCKSLLFLNLCLCDTVTQYSQTFSQVIADHLLEAPGPICGPRHVQEPCVTVSRASESCSMLKFIYPEVIVFKFGLSIYDPDNTCDAEELNYIGEKIFLATKRLMRELDIERDLFCFDCSQVKPHTDFTKRCYERDRRCHECHQQYMEQWRLRNEAQRLARSRSEKSKTGSKKKVALTPETKEQRDRRRKKYGDQLSTKEHNYRMLGEYFWDKKCVDCGCDNPVVFEFDHVRGRKDFNISQAIAVMSWKEILKEIRKCDIRCCNCHAIQTALRAGWYRTKDNWGRRV